MNDPEPVDEQPEAEIRGGNRREDWYENGGFPPETFVKAGLASASGGATGVQEDPEDDEDQ